MSIVVDVGSGIGRFAVAASALAEAEQVLGLEVDEVKHRKALAFVDRTCERLNVLPARRPRLLLADICEVGSLDPASVVLAVWEGFPPQVKSAVGAAVSASRTVTRVCVVQRAIRGGLGPAERLSHDHGFGGGLELMEQFPVTMESSRRKLMAYCFRRDVPSDDLDAAAKDGGGATTPAGHRLRDLSEHFGE